MSQQNTNAAELTAGNNSKPDTQKNSVSLGNDTGLSKLWQRMSLSQAIKFCEQMKAGVAAGVDLMRVIQSQSKTGSKRHREAMAAMLPLIQSGDTLANSMKSQGNYFPPLLVQMVASGELSGQLDRVFGYMVDYYSDLKKSRNDFIGSITWPAIQLTLAIIIISLLIYLFDFIGVTDLNGNPIAVIPGFIGVAGVFKFWGVIAFVFGSITLICVGVWQNWFNTHRILFPWLRRVPVIGAVLVNLSLSRIAITLAMMLGAGEEARRSVRSALRASGNHYYMAGIPTALAAVEQGESLSAIFAAPQTMPDDFIEAIAVGELSGNETDSLERLAVEYQTKARSALKQFAIFAGVATWMFIAGFIIYCIFQIFIAVYLNPMKQALDIVNQ